MAHLWHGHFRILELVGDYAVRLESRDTEYTVFSTVHISKLERVRKFPDRTTNELKVDHEDRVDFDGCLVSEDSLIQELEEGEYEVEEILESRTGKKTRDGRQQREFLVRWKGYEEISCVDKPDLNCRALLQEFKRKETSQNRFEAMQSHEIRSCVSKVPR